MKFEYGALVETDCKRGKQKCSDKSLSQFNVCHRRSQVGWAEMKSDIRGYRPPNNHLRHGKAITSAV